jgi:NAD(P)H-flavin reductase
MSPADAPAGPMTPIPFRVTGRRQETADTWTLELEPGNGRPLAAFEPGQFSMLYAFGRGEVPISVSGDLAKGGDRLVHTVRAVGAVTSALCACEAGEPVGVRGPFGTAWPVADAEGRDVVVVAGGVGLAPLRSAIYRLLANRNRYGDVVILYGSRTPADLLYARELEGWRRDFDVRVEVTVDAAPGDWRGRVGVVPKLVPRADFDPARVVALTCGPEVMMRFTALALAERGVAPDKTYVSLERSMKCGVGHCGHCQIGPTLVCLDGPVYAWADMERWLTVREL